MKYLKLRIAWSVLWWLITVLLLALWMRSYSTFDFAYGPFVGGKAFATWSMDGTFSFGVHAPDWFPGANEWSLHPTPPNEIERDISRADHSRFHFYVSSAMSNVVVPCWFAVVVAAAMVPIPYIAQVRRFSLRTLLLATTLVAVVLGWGVWLVRKLDVIPPRRIETTSLLLIEPEGFRSG